MFLNLQGRRRIRSSLTTAEIAKHIDLKFLIFPEREMLESEGKTLFFYTCKYAKLFYLHEDDTKSVRRDFTSYIEIRFHVLVLPGFVDSK